VCDADTRIDKHINLYGIITAAYMPAMPSQMGTGITELFADWLVLKAGRWSGHVLWLIPTSQHKLCERMCMQ
jgi:hypothetical protein